MILETTQVSRGNELNAQAGLRAQCRSVQGDFMALPFPDESFDGAYAIEATCHAPDRTKVGREGGMNERTEVVWHFCAHVLAMCCGWAEV